MLNVSSIHISFGTNEVLKELSVTFRTGEISGLVGLNGSGKTTLLKTINGSIKHSQGKITWCDQALSNDTIAFCPTDNYYYPYMTGMEYLQLFRQERKIDIEHWNKVFQLPLNELVEKYSTGMKKKLSIIGTLMLERPLVIFDEPFNGLDMEGAEILKLILKELRQKGKTIIITSHVLETLTNCCEEIYYLSDGKIANSFRKERSGELEELIRNTVKKETQGLLEEIL